MKLLTISVLVVVGLFLVVYFVWGEEVDNGESTDETTTTETTEEEGEDLSSLTQPQLAERAISRINEDNVYVVDVRTEAEWETSHVDGAVWWGLEEQLRQGQMPAIPQDSEVYIYCRSGNRSAEATAILVENGFTNVNDAGAFTTMTDAGAEVASGEVILP